MLATVPPPLYLTHPAAVCLPHVFHMIQVTKLVSHFTARSRCYCQTAITKNPISNFCNFANGTGRYHATNFYLFIFFFTWQCRHVNLLQHFFNNRIPNYCKFFWSGVSNAGLYSVDPVSYKTQLRIFFSVSRRSVFKTHFNFQHGNVSTTILDTTITFLLQLITQEEKLHRFMSTYWGQSTVQTLCRLQISMFNFVFIEYLPVATSVFSFAVRNVRLLIC